MVRLLQAASLLAVLFGQNPAAVLSSSSSEENHVEGLRGTAIARQLGEENEGNDSKTTNKIVPVHVPAPTKKGPFLMPIEDVFTIQGRGTVVTGRIERGVIKTGDSVDIVGVDEETKTTTVTGIEMFRKILDRGEAGDNVGILLRGIKQTDVERGQVLAAPDSIEPHKTFKAETYILTKEEGGRRTPFFNGYRPQFYFWTTDVTGAVQFPEGVEMVMPGDNVELVVNLIYPVAMEKGLRFAIREGGRTIGAGTVTEIIE